MKTIIIYCAIFFNLLVTAQLSAQVNAFAQQPEYSRIYSPKSNPFKDGRKALSLAKSTNRRVLIEVGGEWCQYCHILDKFIQSNNDVADAFYKSFVVLKVNVSEENTNREFMSNFARVNGYPHFFITESNGKVIHSTGPSVLSEKGRYTKKSFFNFIKRWKTKN